MNKAPIRMYYGTADPNYTGVSYAALKQQWQRLGIPWRAWSKGLSPELRFAEDSAERVPVVSAGLSARILLGGFAVLHFYAAKPFQRPEESWVTGFFIAPGW